MAEPEEPTFKFRMQPPTLVASLGAAFIVAAAIIQSRVFGSSVSDDVDTELILAASVLDKLGGAMVICGLGALMVRWVIDVTGLARRG